MWPGNIAVKGLYNLLPVFITWYLLFLTFLNLYEFKYTLEIINLSFIRGVLVYIYVSLFAGL